MAAYAEEGIYNVALTVNDVGGQAIGSSRTTFDVADQLVIATGGFTVAGSEGSLTGSQTVATFTDPAGAETLTDYPANISWGDGSAAGVGPAVVGGLPAQ